MRSRILAALLFSFIVMPVSHAAEDEVVVYSSRIEQLIKPMFDAFTKDTGVPVKFVTDKPGPLMERLKAEGANTPADALLTVDAGNLWQAANEGLLKSVQSKVLDDNIPKHLKDPENQWFGLSIRARTIVYNTQKLKSSDLSTYEDLASDKWKGRLCLRTSKSVYNQSLVAIMIAEKGEAEAERIIKGWVKNLATDVFPDDTGMMEAIAAGQCDVGITNSYYYGRLIDKKPTLPLALFWPNQQSGGVHVNVSGMGVVKHAKNEKGAVRLIEWLSSEQGQKLFADLNMEYPANPAFKPDPIVASWGDFKHNLINVAKAGELQAAAVKLMDRARYK
jgi:iron(III) transport system substrate-binding protein